METSHISSISKLKAAGIQDNNNNTICATVQPRLKLHTSSFPSTVEPL